MTASTNEGGPSMYSSFSPADLPQRSPDKQVPIQQMLDELECLCRNQRTGSLYLVSAEQHAGNFTLHEGRIVGVRYACQREERALAALQHLTRVSYRFLAKKVSVSEFQALPETYEILGQLRSAIKAVNGKAVNGKAVTGGTVHGKDEGSTRQSAENTIAPPPATLNPFFSPTLPNSLIQPDLIQPEAIAPDWVESQQQPTASSKATAAPVENHAGVSTIQEPQASEPAPSQEHPPSKSASQTLSSPQFRSEGQQLALEHLATGYLGPVAPLILKKMLRQTQDANTIIQRLKQRIRDPKEAQQFEQEARLLC